MPNISLELIPITKQGFDQQLVDARTLHKFLESETRFNDWINRRIEEFEFIEGRDFYSDLSKSSGGRRAENYSLTLDMAKELSMLERNEKGKQARQYFINAEKQLRTIQSALTQGYQELHELLSKCPSVIHNGSVFYRGNQLLIIARRSRGGRDRKMYNELSKTGEAVKLLQGKQPVWFVKKEAVGKLLNVKPSNNLNVSIVNLLNSIAI